MEMQYSPKIFCNFLQKVLAKNISEIPLEMVENAIVYLKKRGYSKIGAYGISSGSVLAFMSGIIFDDISCVIGVSPTCIIPEGVINQKKVTGKSFLTFRDTAITFTYLDENVPNYRRFQNVYNQRTNNIASIPIERIKGRILLLAGSRDESWNSVFSVNFLKEKLDTEKFTYPYKTCIYGGSHYIGIIPDIRKHKALNFIKLISKEERTHKKQCEIARDRSEKEVIEWLSAW